MRYDYIEYVSGRIIPDTVSIVSLLNELNDLSFKCGFAFGEVFDLRPWVDEFRSWLGLYHPIDYLRIQLIWLQEVTTDISFGVYLRNCLRMGIDSLLVGDKDILEDPEKLQDILKENLLLRH